MCVCVCVHTCAGVCEAKVLNVSERKGKYNKYNKLENKMCDSYENERKKQRERTKMLLVNIEIHLFTGCKFPGCAAAMYVHTIYKYMLCTEPCVLRAVTKDITQKGHLYLRV